VNRNVVTIVVVTASAVLNYLLTQPAGTFSQQVLLVIGAMSVALTAVARYLPTAPPEPTQVQITGPVPVTPTEDTNAQG
jgi:hypothetical protein